MNWTAGILAFVLLYLPCMFVLFMMMRATKRADDEYRERMQEIEKWRR